jgi:hypothetical protein
LYPHVYRKKRGTGFPVAQVLCFAGAMKTTQLVQIQSSNTAVWTDTLGRIIYVIHPQGIRVVGQCTSIWYKMSRFRVKIILEYPSRGFTGGVQKGLFFHINRQAAERLGLTIDNTILDSANLLH